MKPCVYLMEQEAEGECIECDLIGSIRVVLDGEDGVGHRVVTDTRSQCREESIHVSTLHDRAQLVPTSMRGEWDLVMWWMDSLVTIWIPGHISELVDGDHVGLFECEGILAEPLRIQELAHRLYKHIRSEIR